MRQQPPRRVIGRGVAACPCSVRGARAGSACRALAIAGVLLPAAAAAQEPCESGRIAEIVIDNQSVFDRGDLDRGGRFAWAYAVANGLHIQTRPEVIEREMLFRVGDCYDVEMLRDSERLLRGFGFLADANIYGIRLPGGDVQVHVDTQDEWSTRIEPRVGSQGGVELRGLRLAENNLFGTGRHFSLFYDRGREERIYGAAYSTPQLFESRWNLAVQVARTEVGYSFHESVAYPFVGETGRVAFRQMIDRQDRHFELFMPEAEEDLERVRVPVSRSQFEIGAAFRWGAQRYRHTFIGSALAGERVRYPDPPTFAEPESAPMAAPPLAETSWSPISSLRFMLLTGQRNVYFVRRRAIDTVNGTEDVQLGVEVEGSFGPTLPGISDDRDIAVGLGFSAAGEVAGSLLLGGHLSLEARRAYEKIEGLPEWHDVLGEVDVWTYYRTRPESRHLWIIAAAGLGGWHSRVPFQLTLGGDAGLRGYAPHVDPGGRRVAVSLEHRAYIGWPLPDLFDLGTAAFVDVGKIWAGDAPFGTDSPVRASVGVGLRAAFPPGSRQTFRLDIGLPIENGIEARDLTVTIGVGQVIGLRAVRRNEQLFRSSRYGLSSANFVKTYP